MSCPPFISIIIPTQNNEKDLIDCIQSILELDYSPDQLEIIVWDNNSNADSKRKFKEFIENIDSKITFRLIENDDNFGVYASRDELLKKINPRAKFILSIDDDVVLPQNLLKKLLINFQNEKSTGIVGPRTTYDDGSNETAHAAGFVNWWLGRYLEVDGKQPINCDYVIGCCMLIQKAVVDTVGGFDPDYYTSHGEVDFCLKAKARGFKVIYDPGVIVKHRVEMGGTRTLTRLYYIYRNKLFVIKKNAPLPHKVFALALYFLFWLPKILFDSILKNKNINPQELRIILRAIADGWLGRSGKVI